MTNSKRENIYLLSTITVSIASATAFLLFSIFTLFLSPSHDPSIITKTISEKTTTRAVPPDETYSKAVEESFHYESEQENIGILLAHETSIKEPLMVSWMERNFGVPTEKALKLIYTAKDVGNEFSVDPRLILAIISVESSFKEDAGSHAGAIGLMQVVPKWHGDRIKTINTAKKNLDHPETNIRLGTLIYKDFLRSSKNNMARALQMYNGSLGDETKAYSSKVLFRYGLISRLMVN